MPIIKEEADNVASCLLKASSIALRDRNAKQKDTDVQTARTITPTSSTFKQEHLRIKQNANYVTIQIELMNSEYGFTLRKRTSRHPQEIYS
jgi:hypothetical protein